MFDIHGPDRTRLINSLRISTAVWIAILVLLVLVPLRRLPVPERQFREISLTLGAPEPEPAAAVPAAAQAAAAPARQSPARQTAPAQQRPQASTPAAQPASSGVSSLGIANFSTPITSSSPTAASPESLEFSSQTSSTPSSPAQSRTVQEFEGSAALVQSSNDQGASVSSNQTITGTASAETGQALSAITSTAGTGTSSTGTAAGSATGSPSSVSASRTDISFDGTPRELVSSTSLDLPDNLQSLINSSRTVKVSFSVTPSGTVPGLTIFFTPSNVLPDQVQSWLRGRIEQWRFTGGQGSASGSFTYTITAR